MHSTTPDGQDLNSVTPHRDPSCLQRFSARGTTVTNHIRTSVLQLLAFEIWSKIYTYVKESSLQHFGQVCRTFRYISRDPHARCGWLITHYGRELAFYHGFRGHLDMLDPKVGQLMLASGCQIPRFLVQLVSKAVGAFLQVCSPISHRSKYHQSTDSSQKIVSASLYVFFLNAGLKLYGNEADFKEDDVSRFERCLFGTTVTTEDGINTVKNLVYKFGFVPMTGLGSPVDESVYLLSKLHLPIIKQLVSNGLSLYDINDAVIERVLWRPDVSEKLVRSYVDSGFALSREAVKRGLQMGRLCTVQVLRSMVKSAELQICAEEALFDLMGPTLRGWSFHPDSLDFLMNNFPITESAMEIALMRVPGAPIDRPDAFPSTRSYMKANPCPVWRWVLKTYGANHRFAMACFDDAISRASADPDLHALHDVYLTSGIQFSPRHVKIVACRVLHRDMTANALHLLRSMREQVIEKYTQEVDAVRTCLVATIANETDQRSLLNKISDLTQFQISWSKALQEEVVFNTTWEERMRTLQLEGGPRGEAYRILRPPEDSIRFLDEAKSFLAEISSGTLQQLSSSPSNPFLADEVDCLDQREPTDSSVALEVEKGQNDPAEGTDLNRCAEPVRAGIPGLSASQVEDETPKQGPTDENFEISTKISDRTVGPSTLGAAREEHHYDLSTGLKPIVRPNISISSTPGTEGTAASTGGATSLGSPESEMVDQSSLWANAGKLSFGRRTFVRTVDGISRRLKGFFRTFA
ncbi:hypothetical protein DFJ73DRAFT_478754 [Zopfochytrium polystomum]|nr:hypothetical protein DFJ73DRAFT_478754 [Zopfochytrium polystomum]